MRPGSPTSPAALVPGPELAALLARARAPNATPDERERARLATDAHFAASQERIHWLCLRLLARPELAAEAAQETMLVAVRRLPEFRGDSSFHTWLHAIARHVCMKSRARRQELLGVEQLFDPQDPARDALEALRQEERDALLSEANRAVLSPQEQEALVLRYELGVGYDEITALLHLDEVSGARGLLQRCKRKLRRELERRLAILGHGSSLVFGSIGTDG
ncbi:sigma-70 family RNA polymerase sigma factor [Myxococcota bacterium]|nr:sigma-70 family RNA polymerase sigma factor [Myxococcota bacterium]